MELGQQDSCANLTVLQPLPNQIPNFCHTCGSSVAQNTVPSTWNQALDELEYLWSNVVHDTVQSAAPREMPTVDGKIESKESETQTEYNKALDLRRSDRLKSINKVDFRFFVRGNGLFFTSECWIWRKCYANQFRCFNLHR